MRDQTPPPGLPFMKMHGLGNDFVVLDHRAGGVANSRKIGRADLHGGAGE